MPAIAVAAVEFATRLVEAGVLPRNCRRAVIDMQPHKPVHVYYELIGEKESLDVVFDVLTEAHANGDVEVRNVTDFKKENGQ